MKTAILGLMLLDTPVWAGSFGGQISFSSDQTGIVAYVGQPSAPLVVKTFTGIVRSSGQCGDFEGKGSCTGPEGVTLIVSNSSGFAQCTAKVACNAPFGTTFACTASPNSFPQGTPVLFTATTTCQSPPDIVVEANY